MEVELLMLGNWPEKLLPETSLRHVRFQSTSSGYAACSMRVWRNHAVTETHNCRRLGAELKSGNWPEKLLVLMRLQHVRFSSSFPAEWHGAGHAMLGMHAQGIKGGRRAHIWKLAR